MKIGTLLQKRTLLKDFGPEDQIKILMYTGGFWLFMIIIPIFFWVESDPPVSAPWVRIEGNINGSPQTSKMNRTMVTVHLQFRDPEGVLARATVYADKAHYSKANLSPQGAVFIDVEKINGNYLVRRLVTLDGEILFSPALQAYLVERKQSNSIHFATLLCLMGLSQFIAALIIHRRIRREARTSN